MPVGRVVLALIAAAALGIGLIVAFSIGSIQTNPPGPDNTNGRNDIQNEFGIDTTRYFCPPIGLAAIDAPFQIREPSLKSMAPGYELQAVTFGPSNVVSLFYDDQPFCPASSADLRQFDENDAVAISITPQGNVTSAEQMYEADLKSWKSDELVGDRVKGVDINGYKGVGWDLIDAVDKDGEPVQLSSGWRLGTLFFYHEADNTTYAIYADAPLNYLIQIAKTIPLSSASTTSQSSYSSGSPLLDDALQRAETSYFLDNGTKVTYFKNPDYFDEEMLQAYIEMKSAQLKQLSEEQPSKELQAAVSFEHPMLQGEMLEIVSRHSLNVSYFEYVTLDHAGGYSAMFYPNFEPVQYMHEGQGGVTYMIANGTASSFEELNRSDKVILSDIGFFIEIEEARSMGGIAGQSIPRNLYMVKCTTGWVC